VHGEGERGGYPKRTYESGILETLDYLWRKRAPDLLVGVARRGLVIKRYLIHLSR